MRREKRKQIETHNTKRYDSYRLSLMNTSSVAQIRQQFEDLSMRSFVESAPEKKYEVWRDLRQDRPLEQPLEIVGDSDTEDIDFFLTAAENAGPKQFNKENTSFPSKFANLKFETSTPPVKTAVALKPKDVNKPSSLARIVEIDTSKSSLVESLENENESVGSQSPVSSEVFEDLGDKYDETELSPSVRRMDNDKRRLERELAVARERIRELETRIVQMKGEADTRERDIKDARYRAEKAESLANGLMKDMAERESEVEALQSGTIALQKENKDLSERVQRTKTARDEAEKMAGVLTAEIDSWRSKYQEKSAKCENIEVYKSRCEQTTALAEDWKARYEKAVADADATRVEISKKVSHLEHRNKELAKLIGEDKHEKTDLDDELSLGAIDTFTLADCRAVLRYISRKNEVRVSELVPWLNYQRRAFHCYRNFVNKLHLVHYANPRRDDLALTAEIQKKLREGITDDVLVRDLVECLGDLLILSKSHNK